MAQLTYATAITEIRDLIQDADTTAQALTDAQIGRRINDWYLWLYPQGEPRLKFDTHTTTGITLTSQYIGTTTPTTYARIVGVFAADSGAMPIRIASLDEVLASVNSTAGSDNPTQCAPFRLSTGAWSIYFDRTPTGLAIGLLVEYEPTELSGTDAILLRPHETRLVMFLAARDCAMMVGRPQGVVSVIQSGIDMHLPLIGQENAKTIRPRGVAGRA